MKNTLTIVIAFVLAVTAAAGIAYWLGRQDRAAPAAAAAPGERDARIGEELARIRAAEAEPDLYKRCIDYPNPKEFDWSPEVIRSRCKPLTFRMLAWKEIENALDEHHPEKLAAAFDDYQARNEAGQHGFLAWTFWWMFDKPSKWAGETAQRWVDEDPASAHALVARGIFESASAWQARGTDIAANTSAKQFANTAEHVRKARADFEAALAKNPRHIAAYYGLLTTTQLVGDDEEEERRRKWIDAALAIDPADGGIYQEWMQAVAPQWGGSIGEMKDVAIAAAAHADANPSLALLGAEPICNEADHLRCDGCRKDGGRSLALYRDAGKIGPAVCFLDGAGAAAVLADDPFTAVRYYSQAYRFYGREEWIAYRAQNLRSLGEGEWALQDLNAANTREPSNVTVLHALALAYSDSGRIGDVEKAYRRMLDLDPDNATAAIDLAKLYLRRFNEPERARPLVDHVIERDPRSVQGWLVRTMLCDAAADKPCYREAAAHFLEYANPDDPWQAGDISSVRARLAQIGS